MRGSLKTTFVLFLVMLIVLNLSVYAAPQTSIRFGWWGGESRHKATMAAIDLYMKENPNVKINGEFGGFSGYQQKLLVQLVSGTAPDIIQIDQPWVPDLMSQGDLFVNIYREKNINLSGFDKNFLKNQCEWQGKLVGLPTGLNGLVYFVNKDFFAKHKISTNIKWDWDNLLEIGAKVHKANKDDYLLMLDSDHLEYIVKMHVKQHTGIEQWINDDYTPGFTKTSLTNAFAYLQKLWQTGTLPPLEETVLFTSKIEQFPKWSNGQVGMAQNWVSTCAVFGLNGKINLDVMAPVLKKGAKNSGIVVRPSQLLVINKKSSNVKEVAKFVDWFFNNQEAAVVLGTERGIPATQSGLKALEAKQLIDQNMSKGINLSVKSAGIPENALTTNKELTTIFDDYIQKIGFNKLSPEKAAEQMIKDTNAKLAELKRQK